MVDETEADGEVVTTTTSSSATVVELEVPTPPEKIDWNERIDPNALFKDEKGNTFIPLSELTRLGKEKGIREKLILGLHSEPVGTGSLRYAYAHVRVVFDDGTVSDGCGDAGPGNLDDVFMLFAVPMAENRALARALRFGLDIKMCSKEEITSKSLENVFTDDDAPIQGGQKVAINNVCRRKGIKVKDVLAMGRRKVESVDDLTTGEAEAIMAGLNNGSIEKALKKK